MSKYAQGDILAITYDVWISKKKLGMAKKQCINKIEIKETVEGADTATITLSDPEFLFIEDNIFLEENSIKIKLGWSGTSYRHVFKGFISAIDINFGSDGIPILTITCMDRTHKMNRKKKDVTYNNTTSAAVVKKILKSYGFLVSVDKDYPYEEQETITQSNQTDIEFVTKLASEEVYPHTARLVDNKFHYVKMGKLKKAKMTLTYKMYPHEIISFSPKINKETKKVEIKKASMDTSSKSVSSATGTTSSGSSSGGNSSSSGGGSSSSSGSSSSKKASGGYTYNPATKKWDKK